MAGSVAILALACRFPEAESPEALWRNVLEGRRSFREIPPERLALDDYAEGAVAPELAVPPILAGLLSDWRFSRDVFRTPQAAYAAADLSHWLALETAAAAVEAIGGPAALPRERTLVVLGNTLTGETSRAAQIGLRAPYLARRLDAAMADCGLDPSGAAALRAAFLGGLAADFPAPDEETLAGALSNTIAGRIANHFDLHGGAWTVDGACASSLLAVADACARLTEGSADVAIAGAVDLSLDPFELVGFARAGALARDRMRVFDRQVGGFWPGEGCGVAILATAEVARRLGVTPLAWIRGWGVSTDGAGGLTRPTVDGQRRALSAAWARAGLNPSSVGYIEAHGTGTAIGDPTEIRALADLVGARDRPVPVGSIKANIGHCKAAAGMAGLIKTAEAVRHGVIPPHVGCVEAHPIFAETGHRLAPARTQDFEGPRRAGVSGFGFGGVNAHLVIEADAAAPRTPARLASPRLQEAELFLFSAPDATTLAAHLSRLAARAPTLSLGEMTDAAGRCAADADAAHRFRAAVVADRPAVLARALATAAEAALTATAATDTPRVGLMFPGQGAPARRTAGAWAARFPDLAARYSEPLEAIDGDGAAFVQPAVAAAAALGMAVLALAGLRASAALGHSLGELAALCWAGAFGADRLVALAARRGALTATCAEPGGAMVRAPLDAGAAARVAAETGLEIACLNGPHETVLAGPHAAVTRFLAACPGAERLAVSHAFHSAAMNGVVAPFSAVLAQTPILPPRGRVISTVTGTALEATDDLRALLARQLRAPVRFAEALRALAAECDLLIEVGPGAGLARLARAAADATLPPVVATDVGASGLTGLLESLAAAWRAGADLDTAFLFADRPIRPLAGAAPTFIANPCGRRRGAAAAPSTMHSASAVPVPAPRAPTGPQRRDALAAVQAAVAAELGLPVSAATPGARLLGDLHLNSLSVGRVAAAAAAILGLAVPTSATDLAESTVAGLAAHLEELAAFGNAAPGPERIEGVAPWVADWITVWRPCPWPVANDATGAWQTVEATADAGEALAGADQRTGVLRLEAHTLSAETAHAVWQGARAARAAGFARLAVVHRGLPLAGFARSLLADRAFDRVTLLDVSPMPPAQGDIDRVLDAAAPRFADWRLTPDGLETAMLARADLPSVGGSALGPEDVLLVAGGAQGIGLESALRLGTVSGARLALLGRSAAGAESARTALSRAHAAGITAAYFQADVGNPDGLAAAVVAITATLGAPTALLHAAGVNRPARFDDLTKADLAQTLAPKLGGLESLLGALAAAPLRLVIGFGSIIGRIGLGGECHYALANAFMAERLAAWGAAHGVRTLALDWSVWAGAGMGERLGAVERLAQDGVDAIPLTAALDALEHRVLHSPASGRRIVASRFGPPDDIAFATGPPPLLRFLESPLIVFPGVEIVAEAVLSPGTDPWLEDHAIDGHPVVPGVMLLEAMAQAATALTGTPPDAAEEVAFLRAVSLPPQRLAAEGLTLRVAALRDHHGRVTAVIRAGDDGFAADRARATFTPRAGGAAWAAAPCAPTGTAIDAAPLYGGLWFHGGRFRRVETLTHASAFAVAARLAPDGSTPWFGPFLPQDLVLGDPASRDAGLHVLQVCVPQRRVLPVSAARIAILDPTAPRVAVEAVETFSDATSFVFDIAWRDAEGRRVEVWTGARFMAVDARVPEGAPGRPLPDALLPAAVEREAALALDRRDLRVAVADGADRLQRRRAALAAIGADDAPPRGDGAPPQGLSLSHGHALTLAVRSHGLLGCDIVDGDAAPALTGQDATLAERLVAAGVARPTALAVVWAARESARKAGLPLATQFRMPSPEAVLWPLRLLAGGATVFCLPRQHGGAVALLLGPPVAPMAAKPVRPPETVAPGP